MDKKLIQKQNFKKFDKVWEFNFMNAMNMKVNASMKANGIWTKCTDKENVFIQTNPFILEN